MTTQHTETTAHQQTQPHNMAHDNQLIEENDESSYKKIAITLQSDHGTRTVTWEIEKPDSTEDFEVDRRRDFHDALQMAMKYFASALMQAHATSGRGDCNQPLKDSYNKKLAFTFRHNHGPRKVTWKMANRRLDCHDALVMSMYDFASALLYADAISARGDCNTTAYQPNHNTYWLPQEPTDTHIVSGYNLPRDVKVHVPERCGYYCVELVLSCNAEAAMMLKAKSNSLRAGEPLHYSKEELRHLSDLHFSRGSIWRPCDINRGGSHHIRLTFPGTREALDAILPRIQAAVDGETLEFTVSDLAHVSFVEHNKLNGSPVLAKTFYRDFDMQQPWCEYDEYNSSREYWNSYNNSREEQDGPVSWNDRHYWNKADMEQDAVYFSLQFGHLQQQQAKELVDYYVASLEQERIIHTHDSSSSEEWSDALDIQPTSAPSQKDDGGEALADSEDTLTENLTAKSLKLREALLAIDQQIAKLQSGGSSAERSGGIANVQKELDRFPNM